MGPLGRRFDCRPAESRWGSIPIAALEAFLSDRRHSPRARRLAYELLAGVDSSVPERRLPRMLDDPSLELRRDAVARLVDEAGAASAAGQADQARDTYQRALLAARDLDQVQQVAEQLKKLGVETDLARQFGFLTHWKAIGPFDNTGGKGYAAVYPPEKELELANTYDGKTGPVRWVDAVAVDPLGNVDLNQALGVHKGAIGYAYAEFQSNGASRSSCGSAPTMPFSSG